MDPQPPNDKSLNTRDFLKVAGATGGVLTAIGFGLFEWRKNQEKEQTSRVAVLDLFNLPKPISDKIEIRNLNDNNEIIQAAKDQFLRDNGGHGDTVIQVMDSWPFQSQTPAEKLSILPAVKFGAVTKDRIGNPTVNIEISEKKIIDLLYQTDSPVVNMSFEVGQLSATLVLKQEEYQNRNAPLPHILKVGETIVYRVTKVRRSLKSNMIRCWILPIKK
jgi:hypothetical protein